MRETVDVLVGSLIVSGDLVLGIAILLFIIPGPVQRWFLGYLDRFEKLRGTLGLRRATPLLTQVMLLPPRIHDRVGGHGLAPGYVVRWWRARPLAGPIKRLSADPGPQPGVVQQALLSGIVAVPTSVRALSSSPWPVRPGVEAAVRDNGTPAAASQPRSQC
ncbi:hypothetical protein AB0H69_43635 [Streptomyces phaeochromogenes]|uniref:hypothetical protein n=1 Tax=Streptomyces phaeochromogenes TaxID=1923 RepID=UPI0033C68957